MPRKKPRARRRYDTDLTDTQWDLIAPLIPEAQAGGRPRKAASRELVNAILYFLRARQTCFCGVLRSATRASSRRRSVSLWVKVIPLRMRQTSTGRHQTESNNRLFRPGQSTWAALTPSNLRIHSKKLRDWVIPTQLLAGGPRC
ncbi:transposase [Xanthobacter versatilis]|uniref:transposase n=1 Tax=Xanthobacter autotrophicus (strain ATCC BAA-1158 / Py2) TaxID=78245 RepID=UPI00372D6C48